ncbi:hypothetical protein STEG23_000383, partial [Scotinomys teguina]
MDKSCWCRIGAFAPHYISINVTGRYSAHYQIRKCEHTQVSSENISLNAELEKLGIVSFPVNRTSENTVRSLSQTHQLWKSSFLKYVGNHDLMVALPKSKYINYLPWFFLITIHYGRISTKIQHPMEPSQKLTTCLTTEEWIKKMWYIYTMEYYSAEKNNDIMKFAGKWMELENIILSKGLPLHTYITSPPDPISSASSQKNRLQGTSTKHCTICYNKT